jgi:hypothetical protein
VPAAAMSGGGRRSRVGEQRERLLIAGARGGEVA